MRRFQLSAVYLFALLLASLLMSTEVLAQFGGSAMGGSRRGGTDDGSTTSASSRKDRDSNFDRALPPLNTPEQLVSRMSALKAELQLKPEQELAWMKFEGKVQVHIDDLVRQKNKEVPVSTSAAAMQMNGMRHLNLLVDTTRNLYTSLEEVEIRAKELHQTLTSQQKFILDSKIQFIVVREIGR